MIKPSVSIVIPCYNEQDFIGRCLESIADQTVMPSEVIVVDNNCTDDTVAIASSFDFVRIVKERNQGMIPARNTGIAAATTDVVGRIDADCILKPDWVEAVRDFFVDESVDASTGPVFYNDMPLKKVGEIGDAKIREAIYRFLFGSNMAVRRSSWEKIAGELCNDESMHEDIDISIHMLQLGMNIAYNKQMVAGMSARRLEDNPKQFYNYLKKFNTTFENHDHKKWMDTVPIYIYMSLYLPFKTLRAFYDAEEEQLTLKKLLGKAKKLVNEGRLK